MTGDELRSWRKKHRFTQERLGWELEVTRQTVWAWEQSSQPVPRMLYLALLGLESRPDAQAVIGQRASTAEYHHARRQRLAIEDKSRP